MLSETRTGLGKYQVEKLRSVCIGAFDKAPMYRELWTSAGLTRSDLASIENPSILPIVTKQMLHTQWPHGLCSDERLFRKARVISTTGSTGKPVSIAVDRDFVLFTVALFSRPSMVMHLGLDLQKGLHVMVLEPRAIEAQAAREITRAKDSFLDALLPIGTIMDEINKRKPQYILSYPGIMHEVANEAGQRGVELWQPDVLVFSGENLTDPIRASLRDAFPGAALSQAYVATECGGIAVQCHQSDRMHVTSYQTIVEVLDDDGRPCPPGVVGNIVVTGLLNQVTPVIRYSGLGDRGAWSESPCTCPLAAFPLLERIDGRAAESIVLPNGDKLHQFAMTVPLEAVEHLSAFQIRHEAPGSMRILLVPDEDMTDEECFGFLRSEVTRRLQFVLPGVNLTAEVVRSIEREPGMHKTPVLVSYTRHTRTA
jgi:phenylacetate-CoA ligase